MNMTNGQKAAILLTLTVTVGTFVTTITIANVSLPQLQGAFAATQDQITWIVTATLVAQAIATPLSGWLDNRFGRRRILLICATSFTITSILCGLASTLEELVIWRFFQGLSGAPLVPLSQAILVTIYPKEQHGRVLVFWMFGPIIGSILAPLIGGFISEDYSWRWVFMLSVPPAMLCVASLFIFMKTPQTQQQGKKLDWLGFISLSICVTALQLVLDRGQLLDWFDSPIIILGVLLATVTFYLFVSHVCTSDNPFLNPRLLRDRNYAVGILLGFTFGMLYFTTFVLQPTMLQSLRGYPDSLIGLIQATRGIGLLAGAIFLLLFLKNLDPRFNIFLGFLIEVITGIGMSQFDINMTISTVTWFTILQGFGLGMIWSPLMVLALATLDIRYVSEGASVFHLMRNIGSSVHIAATATFVVRSSKENYSVLVESLNPFNEVYAFQGTVGNWSISGATNLAVVSEEIGRQAAMIGYVNAYYLYAVAALVVMPLAYFAKKPKLN